MAIWFTSDLHFNHDKEFLYRPRGFHNIIEMNESIIQNWNSIVNMNDDVYLLGDVCLGGGSDEVLRQNRELIHSLKGKIHLIRGNHDTDTRMKMYSECYNVVDVGKWADVIKYNKYNFYISHYPTITTNYDDKSLKQRVLNLHGHTHDKNKFYDDSPFIYNVALDAQDCKPISIESVIDDIKIKFKEYREEYNDIKRTY